MVNPQKKRTVQELKRLVKEYPIVGVVDMQNLPAPQLQIMRRSLRGKVELKMARRRVIHREAAAQANSANRQPQQ